ncbi:hypothetical protein [Flavobacterium sp. 5]|uniref:hypothetical protein n=1 Tax=Flavobacterium sp. 5 TaxID=2035199 RepID=UPI000C2C5128|nr:hypothetical protein [Flavobacterium sp. 5]PKB15870.1 hypothetical protein CLU82_0972 [Flavobacterium sp. 5]
MKKRLHIFIIILTLGFFLLPALTYACGTKSEKDCCKKEVSSKSEKKECSKNNHSKDKSDNCGGKCGHTNCTTSSVNFSIISFSEIEFKDNNFDFSDEKSKFYDSETFITSGFTSVWLPPKIK